MSFFSSFGGFPFGGGGFGGGDDERKAANISADQEVDNTKFYEVLELTKNASQQEITKQYR